MSVVRAFRYRLSIKVSWLEDFFSLCSDATAKTSQSSRGSTVFVFSFLVIFTRGVFLLPSYSSSFVLLLVSPCTHSPFTSAPDPPSTSCQIEIL